MEMKKSRALSKNIWCKWHNSLISHILEAMQKSLSHVKENIMNLLPKDYKLRKICRLI